MIHSLNIASEGYLNLGLNRTLVIAVSGLLMFPVPEEEEVRRRRKLFMDPSDRGKKKTRKKEKIKVDDHEILYIIKLFLECHR